LGGEMVSDIDESKRGPAYGEGLWEGSRRSERVLVLEAAEMSSSHLLRFRAMLDVVYTGMCHKTP